MVDALRYIDFGLIGLSGKFQGKDSSLLPNRQWIQRQKHKKQPWSNVECFAFGPKDKNRSPFHGEKTQMTK